LSKILGKAFLLNTLILKKNILLIMTRGKVVVMCDGIQNNDLLMMPPAPYLTAAAHCGSL